MSQANDTTSAAPARKPKWISLGILLAVLIALYGVIQFGMMDDAAMRNVATNVLIVIAVVGGWLWLGLGGLFSPRIGRVVLIGGAAAVVLLVGALFTLFEDVSFTGNMEPTLVRRAFWRKGPSVALRPASATKAAPQDALRFLGSDATAKYQFTQFLGNERIPVLEDVRLAKNWDEKPPRLVWKQPIGEGWSSYSVYGEVAVTQEQRGNEELVTCYHLLTGDKLWEQVTAGRFAEVMGGDGPRATPTIIKLPGGLGSERPAVCTLGAFGELNLLDLRDGKPIWKPRNILKDADAKVLMWAMSGSPLIYDDMIVVSAGGKDGKSLVAYDLHTGEPKWFAGSAVAAYCSPTLMTLGGVKQVVILNQENVTGHDAATGAVLWEHEWPGAQPKVSQPVAVGQDRVFCSTGYGLGCKLLEIKSDGAGKFMATDLYGDRNHNMKTKFTNVAIKDGYVYGIDDGIMECLELETGERVWKKGRYGHGQVLIVGDAILVLAENGEMIMLEVNPKEAVELGRFQALEGKTWNNPVLVGPYLLMRNDHEAACYEVELLKEPKEDSASPVDAGGVD